MRVSHCMVGSRLNGVEQFIYKKYKEIIQQF